MNRIATAAAILVWAALCATSGFLALRTNLDVWLNVLYMLVVIALMFALILARYPQGRTGAFWFGFAVVGWGWLLLGLGMSPVTDRGALGSSTNLQTSEYLLTTDLLKSAHNMLNPPASLADVGQYGNRLAAAHLLFTVGAAVVGGAVAIVLRRLGHDQTPHTNVTTSTGRAWLRALIVGSIVALAVFVMIGAVSYFNPPTVTYFSEDVTKPDTGLPAGLRDACRTALRDMREPSLWELSRGEPDLTAYRVVWVDWSGHPTSARVMHRHQETTLTLIVMDGGYGLKRGVVAVRKSVRLTPAQWNTLTQLVEKSGFWSTATSDDDERPSSRGSFVLEGVREAQYHAAERGAFLGGDYDALCRHILDLTGFAYRLKRRSPVGFQ